MYKSVIITLVMCSFVSCTYNSVTLLSEKDLEWMDVYNDCDTVLLSSTSRCIDTMIVSRTLDNSPSILGVHCFSDFCGHGRYEYSIFHNGHKFDGLFVVRMDYDKSAYFLMNWGYRYLHDEEIILHPSDTTTVNVAGKVYSDVLMINDTVSSNVYEDENNCEYFIWSKSKGLLEYKYQNGEVYTFYKKLPYKKKSWFQ